MSPVFAATEDDALMSSRARRTTINRAGSARRPSTANTVADGRYIASNSAFYLLDKTFQNRWTLCRTWLAEMGSIFVLLEKPLAATNRLRPIYPFDVGSMPAGAAELKCSCTIRKAPRVSRCRTWV